jgi:hypothetical protein
MFDRAIIETDKFLNVSLSAKALYFLLGMEADDEGFVSPNRVIRLYGGEMGDIKNLIDTGLIIPFESGVVVITDWNTNNWLDSRRIKTTQYEKEKKLLVLTDSNKYVLSQCLARGEERRGVQNRREEYMNLPNASRMSSSDDAFNQFWDKYPKKELKKKAYEKWKAKKLDSKLPEILSFIEKASSTDRWKKGYIKQPPVFLNGECWNDDLESYNDSKKTFNSYNGATTIL